MALTPLQRRVCGLLAGLRKRSGESYVAGGVALNEAVAGTRRSRHVDLFHDTDAALVATCREDRAALQAAGLRVATLRELSAFVEATVSDGALGYLAWAAAGKDPGFSPLRIVEECARTRYVQAELEGLDFEGPAPSAAEVSRRWHQAIEQAREIVRTLPADEVGKCVLDGAGRLERVSPASLGGELAAGRVAFHEGRVRGAFPEVRPQGPPSP